MAQLLKNLPKCHGTRSFITVFTRTLHWPLFWARWIQSIPLHPFFSRSILISHFHLCPGLQSGLSPSSSPAKTLVHITWPPHLILLDLIILITFGEGYNLSSSALCTFLHPPLFSPLFGPHIYLYNTLFSNTFTICSTLNVRGQDGRIILQLKRIVCRPDLG
jgi:hypothetical protein